MTRVAAADDQRGQVVVLLVMSIVLILGACALVVDVGTWYVTKQRVQTAADQAALAGASALPQSPDAAASMALVQGRKNYNGATFQVDTPYNGDPNQVRVSARVNAGLFFAGLLGIGHVQIGARSTAKAHPGSGSSAIYAGDTACGASTGLLVRVNNITETGIIHSNGSVDIQWPGVHGPISYGGPNNCPPIGGNSGGGSIDPTTWVWPEPFQTSDFACTYTAPSFNLSGAIPPGVYCATGAGATVGGDATATIRVNTGASGNVTLIGWKVTISDHNISLAPNSKGVLAFATGNITSPGTGAIDINGNNMTVSGTMFAPNGRVNLNGNSGFTANAFLEGKQVEIDGNNWTLNGTGAFVPAGIPSLIQ